MKIAIIEAKKGVTKGHGGPFGCVIVRKGKIIAKAHNQVIRINDPTAHAEMLAIREASKKLKNFDLSGCELYSTSAPCPMCFSAIDWAKIKKVYYGCTKRDAAHIGFDDKHINDIIQGKTKKNPVTIKKGLNRKECLEVFKLWSEKEDKKKY